MKKTDLVVKLGNELNKLGFNQPTAIRYAQHVADMLPSPSYNAAEYSTSNQGYNLELLKSDLDAIANALLAVGKAI